MTQSGAVQYDAGDIVWVDFNPVRGTEQAGRRPALVVSSRAYHSVSRRALVCPVTSRVRGWPTAVLLPPGLQTVGEVLADQIRAVDREARFHALIERAPDAVLAAVRGKIAALVGVAPAAA